MAIRAGTATRRSERGAAAVEFAIVSTLMFTLLFGMLQYGIYFWSLQSGADAARTAARAAAVGSLDCAAFDTLIQQNARGVDSDFNATRTYYDAGDVALSTAKPTPEVGDIVRVTVSYDSLDFGFPFVPFLADGRISEVAVARVETTTSTSVACT